MTFEIEIGGRVRSVAVEPLPGAGPRGGPFRLSIDGRAVEVDAQPTDLGLSLLFRAEGRTLDTALTERAGGEWLVQLPHVAVTALVDGRRFRRGGADEPKGHGAGRLTAPMPGRVVRVLVKPGDEVSARQGLVVVEAMKMENELTAPRAGRVTEVAVTEGQSVESGRLLVQIE
jgi:biotin carboxyl carrier protein